MALGFIKKVLNLSDQDISFDYLDSGWQWVPHGFVISSPPKGPVSGFWLQGKGLTNPRVHIGPTVSAAPSIMQADGLNVPWAGAGHLDLWGPRGGYTRFIIGPNSLGDLDLLRMFDPSDNVLGEVELGPRGGGWWSAVWDWHVVIEADQTIRWVTWDVNTAGMVFADQAKKLWDKLMDGVSKEVFK